MIGLRKINIMRLFNRSINKKSYENHLFEDYHLGILHRDADSQLEHYRKKPSKMGCGLHPQSEKIIYNKDPLLPIERECKGLQKPRPFNLGFCSFDPMLTERDPLSSPKFSWENSIYGGIIALSNRRFNVLVKPKEIRRERLWFCRNLFWPH